MDNELSRLDVGMKNPGLTYRELSRAYAEFPQVQFLGPYLPSGVVLEVSDDRVVDTAVDPPPSNNTRISKNHPQLNSMVGCR